MNRERFPEEKENCFKPRAGMGRDGTDMKAPKGKYAGTATVGEKGQIVIPKAVRDMFDIKPGDALLILADKDRGIAIPPKESLVNITMKAFAAAEEKEEEE